MNKYLIKIAQMEKESSFLAASLVAGARALSQKAPRLVPGHSKLNVESALQAVGGRRPLPKGHLGNAVHTTAFPASGRQIDKTYDSIRAARGDQSIHEMNFAGKRRVLKTARDNLGPDYKEFSRQFKAQRTGVGKIGSPVSRRTDASAVKTQSNYNTVGGAADVVGGQYTDAVSRVTRKVHDRLGAGEAIGQTGMGIGSLF